MEVMEAAVWIGRYQPLHLGHLRILGRSLAMLPIPHVIGLVCYEQDLEIHENERKHQRAANPFSPWERRVLADLSLGGAGLAGRTDTVYVPYLSPERWHLVEAYLPPRPVFCVTDKDQGDLERVSVFERLQRRWALINVMDLDLVSGTDLRHAVRRGEPWQPYLHEASHEFFAVIDGPRRLATSRPS